MKTKVLDMALREGANKTAKKFGIPTAYIYTWRSRYPKNISGSYDIKRKRKKRKQLYSYPEEMKAEVVNQAERQGRKQLSYPVEMKTKVLEMAEREGVINTARKFGIPPSYVYVWRNKSNSYVNQKVMMTKSKRGYRYSEEMKEKILELAEREGVTRAAKACGVPQTTICLWRRRNRMKTSFPYSNPMGLKIGGNPTERFRTSTVRVVETSTDLQSFSAFYGDCDWRSTLWDR